MENGSKKNVSVYYVKYVSKKVPYKGKFIDYTKVTVHKQYDND